MHRYETSEDAIEELKTRGTIDILETQTDHKIYDRIILKHKTKDQLISMMKEEGFSEFIIGTFMGMFLTLESKIKPKGGLKRFIPTFMRR